MENVVRPTLVGGLSGATDQLTVGSQHTCALARGELRCWGAGRAGALGNGSSNDEGSPVLVTATSIVAGDRVVAGQQFTCVLHSSTLGCWGSPPGFRVVEGNVIAAGAHGPTLCVVRAGGAVACGERDSLREVAGMTNASAVAVGSRAVCAIQRGGAVSCAGLPYRGPRLDQPFLVPETTALVAGLTDVVEAAIVGDHLVARRRSGGVVSVTLAGAGAGGPPAPLAAIADAVSIADFGDTQVCAVRANGDLACLAPLASEHAPIVLAAEARVIAGGPAHACVILKSGGVACWGENSRGAIGNGGFGYRASAGDIADD